MAPETTTTCYRFGYAIVNVVLVALLGSVPGTTLWEFSGTSLEPETVFTLIFALFLSIGAFVAVQGSDPGYLGKDTAPGLEQNTRGLLRREPSDDLHADGGVELTTRQPAATKSGSGSNGNDIGGSSKERRNSSGGTGGRTSDETKSRDNEIRVVYAAEGTTGCGHGNRGGGANRSKIAAAARAGSSTADMDTWLDSLAPRTYDPNADPTFCEKCDLPVPLRSHHCRACGRCVATFDHHCRVIGTCIGERNHCRFWWFLVAQSLTLLVALGILHSGEWRSVASAGEGDSGTIPLLDEAGGADTGAIGDGTASATLAPSTAATAAATGAWLLANAATLAASAALWGVSCGVFPLLAFHTWLAAVNMTGFECLRGPEGLRYLEGTREFDLPFSQGPLRNLQGFCCARDGCWALLGRVWRPTRWRAPGRIERNSINVFDNLWENKYWSCC